MAISLQFVGKHKKKPLGLRQPTNLTRTKETQVQRKSTNNREKKRNNLFPSTHRVKIKVNNNLKKKNSRTDL